MFGFGRYGALARTPGFWLTALPALIARLPLGMTGLALVLVTTAHGGSYAAAGAASASCAVAGAVSAPLRGRAIDRRRPGTMLMALAWAQAGTLIAFMAVSSAGGPLILRCALAAVIGAVLPPVGPMMRTLWQRLLDRGDLRDAAFAMESIVIDIVYIAGPLLVAAAMVVRSADLGLLLMAAMTVAGCSILARSPAARGWRDGSGGHDWLGPLRARGVLLLLPIDLFAVGSIGAFEIGAVATAGEHGLPAAAGFLIAGTSVGSVVGGLYWGSRRQPGSQVAQQAVLLAALACGFMVAAQVPSLIGVGLVLALTGLALAPMNTVQFGLMQRVAPASSLTEAFSWLNSSGGAGLALGAAAAGLAVSHAHAPAAFLLGAALAGVSALLSLGFGAVVSAERLP
jgi:MFS family permease